MEWTAGLFVLAAIPILAGLSFGVSAVVCGRIRATRGQTLNGTPARAVGVMLIVLALAYWWFVAELWGALDR
jgi:hypothetical protein